MGLKSAWNEIVRYNKSPISKWASDDGRSVRTPRQQFFYKAFLGALWGAGGILLNSASTHFREGPAQDSEKAGQIQTQYYQDMIAELSEMDNNIRSFSKIVADNKTDVLLGTVSPETQTKVERAKVKIEEYKGKLGDEMWTLSQQLLTDKNIPEPWFDYLVNRFDDAVSVYALPSYVSTRSSWDGRQTEVAWDSRLRECQVKFRDPSGNLDFSKAEAVAACTGDQVFSRVVAPGFGVGSGLFFAWILAVGPALAARRRKPSQDAAQNDKITTSLKITYETPKKG